MRWWLILAGALSVIFGLMVLCSGSRRARVDLGHRRTQSCLGNARWFIIAAAETPAHVGRYREGSTLRHVLE